MKNNKLKYTILAIAIMVFNSQSNAQATVKTCTETTISGNKHGHLTSMDACDNAILITATVNEPNGSIITGTFTSFDKITVTPGTSTTRILAATHNEDESIIFTHGRTHLKIKRPTVGRFAEFKKTKAVAVTISPNPTKNTIHITAKKPINNVALFDIYGALLLNNDYNKKNEDITINLESYKQGFYIIKIKLENDKLITKTIVKE